MMMIQDYAHTAFEAAGRGDMDGVYGTLTEITRQGRVITDQAMRRWMDRCLFVMRLADDGIDALLDDADDDSAPDRITHLILESDATGEVGQVDDLAPEIAWAGRMFAAHIADDDDTREALWSAIPGTFDAIADHVTALLTTMTTTAAAYAEDVVPDVCCALHNTMTRDPMATAAKIAVAHLN